MEAYLMFALAPSALLVPILGLILLGHRAERQRLESLLREHASRVDRLTMLRGGR